MRRIPSAFVVTDTTRPEEGVEVSSRKESGGAAIHLEGGGGIGIYNCTIAGCGAGVDLDGVDGAIVGNNTFIDNSGPDIRLKNAKNIVVAGNRTSHGGKKRRGFSGKEPQ